jgi:diguanylate cyclase (GGDEF)-like protein
MTESLDLMQTEYYAMKLVTIACEIDNIPQEVRNVELKKQDAELSGDEKMKLAQKIVHDTTYHRKKDTIRSNMEKCLTELEKQTHIIQNKANDNLEKRLNAIRVVIFVQLAITVIILVMTSLLVIMPIIRGVYSIKKDEQLPVEGSYEFRYLAKTYNSMYEAFKKSIASLNYEASHDKLTGLYNRAGYDVLSRSIDLQSTAVLMIDADKFKEINDHHGHDVGDKILQKIARVLKNTFRSEDDICRIGGDEFVVFMMHVSDELRDLIILKTKQINNALADVSDGLPSVSLSIGIAFGHDAPDTETLLKHADEALYNVKEHGRSKGCFYETDKT